MNLFEKINLFEKMATQSLSRIAEDTLDALDGAEESNTSNKESIQARTELLRDLLAD